MGRPIVLPLHVRAGWHLSQWDRLRVARHEAAGASTPDRSADVVAGASLTSIRWSCYKSGCDPGVVRPGFVLCSGEAAVATPAEVAACARVPSSVVDCDQALMLLRRVRREGTLEQREVAQVAIDDVLDRRLELTAPLAVRSRSC